MVNHELSALAIWIRKLFAAYPEIKDALKTQRVPGLRPLQDTDLRDWVNGASVPAVPYLELMIAHVTPQWGTITELISSKPVKSVREQIKTGDPDMLKEIERIMWLPLAKACPNVTPANTIQHLISVLADHVLAAEVQGTLDRLMHLPFNLRRRALHQMHMVFVDMDRIHSPSWDALQDELMEIERSYAPEQSEKLLSDVLTHIRRVRALHIAKS